jgi:hypothetical protein
MISQSRLPAIERTASHNRVTLKIPNCHQRLTAAGVLAIKLIG